MKASKKYCSLVIAVVIVMIVAAWPPQLCAHTAGAKPFSERNKSGAAQWSVQVDKVDPGNVDLEPAFQLAIYENLLDELDKSKRFKQVLRSGDSNASHVPDLLILKTTVQSYRAGGETRGALTAVSGATKLNVRSQLSTRDGRIILERVVDGNVRSRGSNLRATHNLARNVAKKIKQALLPELSPSAPALSIERTVGWAEFGASSI